MIRKTTWLVLGTWLGLGNKATQLGFGIKTSGEPLFKMGKTHWKQMINSSTIASRVILHAIVFVCLMKVDKSLRARKPKQWS